MKQNVKMRVSNNFLEPITLWLEPWGADFGMMPEDEFEIIAENADEDFYFHIVFNKDLKIFKFTQKEDKVIIREFSKTVLTWTRVITDFGIR